MTLSDEQRAAVEREGQDVCVVAGPGSGKTRVLVERFAWLVRRGTDPLRVLAITFTEKAANELKTRLLAAFHEPRELRTRLERAYVSTVHGFCARLLREYALEAGVDPRFEILEERYGLAALRRAAEQALDELLRLYPTETRTLLEFWQTRDPVAALVELYQDLRAAAVRPADLPTPPASPVNTDALRSRLLQGILETRVRTGKKLKRNRMLIRWAQEGGAGALERLERLATESGDDLEINDVWASVVTARFQRQRALLLEALKLLDSAYSAAKRSEGLLDFSDLELRSLALLQRQPALCATIRESFDAILMDELQDTNPVQAQIVERLRRPGCFFAVGDSNQSIFGFRHAEPAVFGAFRQRIESGGFVVDRLTGNFRSRPEILDAVSLVLRDEEGIEPFSFRPERRFAESTGPFVEILEAVADDADSGARIEAAAVASRIVELSAACPLTDMAVLVRTTAALDPLLEAFAGAGIPYLLTTGRGFYEAREVRDALHLLKALANAGNEISVVVMLRSAFLGVPDQALLDARRSGGIQALLPDWFIELRAQRDRLAPDALVGLAMDYSGYSRTLDWRARGNLDKLQALLRSMHAARPRPLADLVEELDSLRAAQPEPEAPPSGQAGSVQVMTVHAAKGLEFPVVFLAGLHRGVDRQGSDLLFSAALSPQLGIGARWLGPAGKGVLDEAGLAIREAVQRREREESNRLLFVAMTRPESRLVLSWARRTHWARLAAKLLDGPVPVAYRRFETAPACGVLARTGAPDEVEEIAAPAVASRHPSSTTVTAIAAFAAGLPVPAEPSTPGAGCSARFGTQVHRLLAGESVPGADPEAVTLAFRFHGSELGIRARQAARREHEFGFLFAIEDVVLRGQIDLWFEDGADLILVDYKTGQEAGNAAAHRLQVQLYAMALERHRGRLPDRAVIYHLREDRAVDVPLDAPALEAARHAVRAWRDSYRINSATARSSSRSGQ